MPAPAPQDSDRTARAGAALAAALAQRVAPHLPAGLTAHADGGLVYVRAVDGTSGGTDIAWMLAANPRPWEELVVAVIERALNAVQDKAAEASGSPWPGEGTVLPLPWALVDGDVVRLGYGEPDAPTLALASLELAGLRQP